MGTIPKHTNDRLQGTLDLLVLKTLAAQGAMPGYGITLYIERISKVLRLEDGSLYPALHRMDARDGLGQLRPALHFRSQLLVCGGNGTHSGWLRAEWGASDNNRRARFYSSLAPEGTPVAIADFLELQGGVLRIVFQ